jgi:very-short-patch-repair endonuclease
MKNKQNREKITFARQLRKNSTDAERLIWSYLRSRSLEGIKFRRQQPFGPYIVDFISTEKKLVIELDGGQHSENRTLDEDRDQFIESEGYRIIRFWNNEALQNTEGVLERIRQEILKSAPSPRPSPPEGRGS